MFSYQVGQFVILFFFECCVIERGIVGLFVETLSQIVEHFGIIENAMHIASPTVVVQVVAVFPSVFQQGNRTFGRVAE